MHNDLRDIDYPSGWKMEELARLLSESRVPALRDDPSKRITVRLHLGGVVQRDERDNDKIGATRYFVRSQGQFIYGKQNLHKGAIGIVPAELDGFHSTQDVPAFDVACVPEWLVYYFSRRHVYESLERLAEGTGSRRIHPAKLLKERIALPDREEQLKIVDVLRIIDRAINTSEAFTDKSKRINRGLVQNLMTLGIDDKWCIRNEETHKFQDSELGAIPEEWTVDRLTNTANRISVGLATSVTKYYREAGVPIIRNQNIRRGYCDDSEMLYLDPAFASRFPGKKLRQGDVLICRTGANVGDSCAVPERYVGAHTFTTLIVSPQPKRIATDFMVRYLNSERGTKELNHILVGAGKNNLNVGQLVKFRLMMPSVPEQNRISAVLRLSDTFIDEARRLTDKLALIKRGLLEDLLAGSVRVNDIAS
jgi:type I restriction enzyme S subunit